MTGHLNNNNKTKSKQITKIESTLNFSIPLSTCPINTLNSLHTCCWQYALASWPHPCSASFIVPFTFPNNWSLLITLAPNNTQISHFKPFHLVKNLTHYHHSKILLKPSPLNLSTPLTDLYESISLLSLIILITLI